MDNIGCFKLNKKTYNRKFENSKWILCELMNGRNYDKGYVFCQSDEICCQVYRENKLKVTWIR